MLSRIAREWEYFNGLLTLTPSGTVSDGNSGNNYTYTFDSTGTGTINPKALTVTANNKTIVAGSSDPALTYSYTGLASGDASATFAGALARTPGETVGTYSILQNTLAATGNYTIGDFNPGVFTINAVNAFSITDIPSTVVITSYNPLLNSNNNFADALDPIAGTNMGTLNIVQSPIAPGRDYTISRDGDGGH